MKVAIIGSRSIGKEVALSMLSHLPEGVSEIVTGGAVGVDSVAENLADTLGIPLRVFRPDYTAYGRRAPLVRNLDIIHYADEVLAFWDGVSHGTRQVILACIKCGKPVKIIPLPETAADPSPEKFSDTDAAESL